MIYINHPIIPYAEFIFFSSQTHHMFTYAQKTPSQKQNKMTFSPDIKALVVDDIPAMRLILRQMLRSLGIQQVLEAADGSSALIMLREQPVDVILSDWNMIPMTGLQLLLALREEPLHTTTPFIMITGQQTTEYVARARQAGVSGYLLKPFGMDALARQLRRVLPPPRLRHPVSSLRRPDQTF